MESGQRGMMKPYYQDSHVAIYHRDCLKHLPAIEDNSVDLIATDPPYGYSFMGKDWDRAVPDIEVWRECLRVLKPGAFAFVMCAPRQDCLGKMICNLSDAGFETGFSSIYWTYASGFPKAQDVSLTIDKQECRRQLEAELGRKATKDEMEKDWKGFRDFVGRRLFERSPYKADGTISASRQKGYLNTGHFRMGDETYDITAPATPQAQALDGSYAGFQPKPAVEVILVCMKPLSEKTYVEQALKNQKGVTWLDDCRIGTNGGTKRSHQADFQHEATAGAVHATRGYRTGHSIIPLNQGRFPANLLVSDDVLDDGMNRHIAGNKIEKEVEGAIFGSGKGIQTRDYYGDSGSFSRYFDIDRWWAERVKGLPESVQRTYPFLIVSKASKAEKNRGCEELYWEPTRSGYVQIGKERWLELGKEEARIYRETGKRVSLRASGNIHSTVKALKLMSYLITLGSREGDVILDPFVGSGTTCLAAQLLGRRSIGIENDESFCEIAANRCRQMVMEF